MAMLDSIKKLCGISDGITAYDEELNLHIQAGLEDMKASGVPSTLCVQSPSDKRVTECVALYVMYARAIEPNTMSRYDSLYKRAVFRLTLEDGDEE